MALVEGFTRALDPLGGTMFRLYRITGPSMEPALSAGDVLLLRRRRARIGEIVVVNHPDFKTIVKRIDEAQQLSGDNPASASTADLGAYDPATLIGVAVLAITPSGLRRLSARQSETRA